MQIEMTTLSGVQLLTPRRFGDARGWFVETWSRKTLLAHGVDLDFVQDNHSLSGRRGTLRGMHFQAPPYAQDKLVRCTRGAIFDVAVDIRRGSSTYGHWTGVTLCAEKGQQLLVPKGFLHGFQTLTDDTEVQYKCTDYYVPASEGCVHWSSLGIDWPIDGEPVVSDKDNAAAGFDAFESPFTLETGQ